MPYRRSIAMTCMYLFVLYVYVCAQLGPSVGSWLLRSVGWLLEDRSDTQLSGVQSLRQVRRFIVQHCCPAHNFVRLVKHTLQACEFDKYARSRVRNAHLFHR